MARDWPRVRQSPYREGSCPAPRWERWYHRRQAAAGYRYAPKCAIIITVFSSAPPPTPRGHLVLAPPANCHHPGTATGQAETLAQVACIRHGRWPCRMQPDATRGRASRSRRPRGLPPEPRLTSGCAVRSAPPGQEDNPSSFRFYTRWASPDGE